MVCDHEDQEAPRVHNKGQPTPEIDNNSLFNCSSSQYILLSRIRQMMSSLYYLLEDMNIDKNRELIKDLLYIYQGRAGPKIIDYFLDHGAAANYVLSVSLGYQKQTIQHNLETLEVLGFVEEKVLYKRLRKRGPKTNVWMLKGALPRACEQAIIEHMRPLNPERAKRIEEEDRPIRREPGASRGPRQRRGARRSASRRSTRIELAASWRR